VVRSLLGRLLDIGRDWEGQNARIRASLGYLPNRDGDAIGPLTDSSLTVRSTPYSTVHTSVHYETHYGVQH
jgi:hypothetical protein